MAEGEQDKAKAMLDVNKNFALVPADVIDLSKQEFKGITGFQYAVWALDWHMWKMIRSYLTTEEAKLQCEEMDTGAWVNKHGIHANWDNLIIALKIYIDNYDSWTGEQCKIHWIQQVGGAQVLLPAHVVNEYCHPARSFEPCPNYTTADPLPRARRVEVYDNGSVKDGGEWFICSLFGQELGKTFAFYRGARPSADGAVRGIATWCMRIGKLVSMLDHAGIAALYSARTRQRNDLITELQPKNSQVLIRK